VCGSREVAYTCDPACCFNHLCGSCYATFEPVTRAAGGEAAIDCAPAPPDSCAPTVACARCQSLAIYTVVDEAAPGLYACAACHALLELDFENVVPKEERA
jgi:hypothetical protein